MHLSTSGIQSKVVTSKYAQWQVAGESGEGEECFMYFPKVTMVSDQQTSIENIFKPNWERDFV